MLDAWAPLIPYATDSTGWRAGNYYNDITFLCPVTRSYHVLRRIPALPTEKYIPLRTMTSNSVDH